MTREVCRHRLDYLQVLEEVVAASHSPTVVCVVVFIILLKICFHLDFGFRKTIFFSLNQMSVSITMNPLWMIFHFDF